MTQINMSPKALANLMIADMTGGDPVEAAVCEGRCVNPPMGCGQPIQLDRQKKEYVFPTEAAKREWKITGICPNCWEKVVAEGEESEDGDTIVRGLD